MRSLVTAVEPKVLMKSGAQPREYAPIVLGSVMRKHGMSMVDLSKAVKQTNGRTISRTALSFLLNYDLWPAGTPRDSLRAQIEAQLRARGVRDAEISLIWRRDEQALYVTNQRHARPKGFKQHEAAPTDLEDFNLPEKEMLTRDTKKHFQLLREPFSNGGEEIRGPEDVYLSADQRYIREAMYTTAKSGGFIAVIGESGAGKSTLRKDLIARVQKEGLQILFIQPKVIDKKKLTARSVCEAILDDLAPGRSMPNSLERMARRVEQLLTESYKTGNRHVLLIEEAQDLEPRALKHLKRFYEIEAGYAKLLSVILVGQPELGNLLDERQHFDLREVIRRCEIASCSRSTPTCAPISSSSSIVPARSSRKSSRKTPSTRFSRASHAIPRAAESRWSTRSS
jgi:type II secretory pathway predicted ATPase ExeA